MCPRTGLDAVAKRKNPLVAPAGKRTPDRPTRSLVTTLSDLPWLHINFSFIQSIEKIW
jgi:hypothetical protein